MRDTFKLASYFNGHYKVQQVLKTMFLLSSFSYQAINIHIETL